MSIFSGKSTSYITQYRVDVVGKHINLGITDSLIKACDFARFVSQHEEDTIRVHEYIYRVRDGQYKLESATIHSEYRNGMRLRR